MKSIQDSAVPLCSRADERTTSAETALAALTTSATDLLAMRPDANVVTVGALMYRVMEALQECEASATPPQAIRERLQQARALLAQSPLCSRLQKWPRGYVGDWETIEYISRGVNLATPGTTGSAVEAWILQSPPVLQHRNKLRHQAELILRAALSAPSARPVTVLSAGCGPCADIRQAVRSGAPIGRLELILNDTDADALAFATDAVVADGVTFHSLQLHCSNALSFSRTIDADLDLAMAGGLFDYLDDRQCRLLIRQFYRRLRPGGRLYFSNMAAGNPYRAGMEYLTDWPIRERSQQDVTSLCTAAGVPEGCVRISRDDTGLALLVEAVRV